MRLILSLTLGLCTLCLAFGVRAAIYKYIDEQGNVIYTDTPLPGAKKLEFDPPLAQSTKPPAATQSVRPRHKPSPAYFPKVDPGTQRRRDDMRRQLLMQELASEQRNLEAARRALTEASRQPGANLRQLAESVRMHERNIEMLNKELALMR